MELPSWDTSQGDLLRFCMGATSRGLPVVLLIVVSFYGSWLWSLLTSTLAQAQKIKSAKKDHRLELDDAIMRRSVRDEFFRNNKNFDYNCNSSKGDKEKGLNVTESFVKNSKGMEIFVKSWEPADFGQLHGLIFLCLGYGDSVTFYAEGLARALAVAGYGVYGMDYPGFGMSEGLHGYIPNMGNLVDDIIEQYQTIKDRAELRGLPCFVYGESMGGALALRTHLKAPTMWDGAILAAPMCKIVESMYPSPIMVQVLTKLAQVIPKAKLVSINDIMKVGFRDEVKRKHANLNPVFYVGYTRLGTGVQLLRTADYVEKRMHEVKHNAGCLIICQKLCLFLD
ncbi:hypothetical protein KC19_7G116000 [Ceratodon purpureus]|uniref:Serine aminopeptidase S33 domain-containing protein n=1 Tax=Ceratodon purpureus TaxID=3225 RepID=A0A8T0H7F0_CERPU|nr:hypothetical protein KC19_7G116000 [Ceratodon purpureus]